MFRTTTLESLRKNICEKDFAELWGDLSGAICLELLFYSVMPSASSEMFFGSLCAIFRLKFGPFQDRGGRISIGDGMIEEGKSAINLGNSGNFCHIGPGPFIYVRPVGGPENDLC